MPALRGGGRPAPERPDAGQQLREGERLGEVVVGAGVEAGHAVVHGSRARSGAGRASRSPLARSRRSTVMPSMSGRPRSRTTTSYGAASASAIGRHPVRGDVHHVALGHEDPLDQGRHLRFVFDHEDSHRAALCGRPAVRSRAGGLSVRTLIGGSRPGGVVRARQWDHKPLHAGRTKPMIHESPSSPRRSSRPPALAVGLAVAGLAPAAAPVAAEPVVGARRCRDGRAGSRSSRSTPSTSPPRRRPRTSSSSRTAAAHQRRR